MQEEEDYQAVNGGTPWSVLVYFCSIDTMYCIRYRGRYRKSDHITDQTAGRRQKFGHARYPSDRLTARLLIIQAFNQAS